VNARDRAHVRSGDAIAIGAYVRGGRSFDHAILEFSEAYARQNQLDYDELARAVKSGRITAKAGV
jgi:hypothetical protein